MGYFGQFSKQFLFICFYICSSLLFWKDISLSVSASLVINAEDVGYHRALVSDEKSNNVTTGESSDNEADEVNDEEEEEEDDQEQDEDKGKDAALLRGSISNTPVPACLGLRVKLEGCEKSILLWAVPSSLDAQFGSAAGIGNQFLRYPLNVAQIGSRNQLYWDDWGKYYIYWSGAKQMGGTKKTSRAAWFHLTPGNRMRTSRIVNGKRKYYYFKATKNFCTNDFKVELEMNEKVGKYVIFDGCAEY